MSAIEDELKKLLAEQQSLSVSIKSATSAVTKSQGELNEAKAREAAVSKRLAPLQQLAGKLAASREAVKKQRETPAPEIEEAEKLHKNVFPAAVQEIKPAARKALEDAEAARAKSEEAREALRKETAQAEAAQAAARAEAATGEARVRELVVELEDLADRMEAARRRVAERLPIARKAIAAGKPGETFLALRDLDAKRAEFVNLVAEGTDKELLKKIDAVRAEMNKATEKAASQAPILDTLKQKLATADKDLESKRKAAEDARAAVAATQPP